MKKICYPAVRMFNGNISQGDKLMRQFLSVSTRFFSMIVFAALLFAVLPLKPVFSAPHPAEERLKTVSKIEKYLRELKTMKAHFTQTAPNGEKTSGVFYLQRPGKMRFEYDPPIEDFIVADGLFIYFYDAEMENQSSTAIGNSLADFILRENIRLSGDIKILGIEEGMIEEKKTLEVTLTQTADPGAGNLTLIFRKDPMQLVSWVINDAQGLTTTVALWESHSNIHLPDESLFRYRDPKLGNPRYNK
ncbi:MAG: outer membrane lipoprotein carrier protein LolA [Alphaproteobacteria bacterium]|nr:MAG: outer membrane lipoprotein carrier protein LolA [Alphaproteobacteria bacterium]